MFFINCFKDYWPIRRIELVHADGGMRPRGRDLPVVPPTQTSVRNDLHGRGQVDEQEPLEALDGFCKDWKSYTGPKGNWSQMGKVKYNYAFC